MGDRIRLEVTIEPFVEGDPGPHVLAAHEAAAGSGLSVEVGPFGSAIEGPTADVLAVVQQLVERPLDHGASRLTLQVERL